MTFSVEIVIEDDSGRRATWVIDNVHTMAEADAVAEDLVQYARDSLGIHPERLDQ